MCQQAEGMDGDDLGVGSIGQSQSPRQRSLRVLGSVHPDDDPGRGHSHPRLPSVPSDPNGHVSHYGRGAAPTLAANSANRLA